MKKLLIILLLVGCFTPAPAQQRARSCLRTVRQIISGKTVRQIYPARVVNMPGAPLVSVHLPKNVAAKTGGLLSARLLTPGEVYRFVNLDAFGQLHVPQSFTRQESAVYRGLSVENLPALARLFRKGMEIEKSEFPEIYSSHKLGKALGYIFPSYEKSSVVNYELPVLVKIPLNKKILKNNPPAALINDDIIFNEDIDPRFISEIMVFLEINGRADWYRVVMEKGEVKFLYTPTTRIADYE